jgi:hypothetical protein
MNRRDLLKLGGSAALVIAAPALAIQESLESQIERGGLIANQTFHIDRPVIINGKDIVFENCKFTGERHKGTRAWAYSINVINGSTVHFKVPQWEQFGMVQLQ